MRTKVAINGLSGEHVEHLLGSAISREIIAERGYRTVHEEDAKVLASYGVPAWARQNSDCFPGILIPMYSPAGERTSCQYRPDSPVTDTKGKLRRYVSQGGRASVLDVHPRNVGAMADPRVPLWITEGVKKADALTSAGPCVVALAGVFNWRSSHGTLGDWEDVMLKGREVIVCFDSDTRDNPQIASAMGRLGKWCKSKNAKKVRYLVVPGEHEGVGTKGADDFLAAGGSLTELLRKASDTPPPVVRARNAEFTEAVMAETVAYGVLSESFLWTPGWGWMEYAATASIWRRVEDAVVIEVVRKYIKEQFIAAVESGSKEADDLYKLLKRKEISNIMALTRGMLMARVTDFDANPDILGCRNGAIDLTSGELIESCAELMLTKSTGIDYDPDATNPGWESILAALPRQSREWMQVRIGQAATGYMTPDDLLILSSGDGSNGKSTFFSAIREALGSYFHLVSERVLLANPDAHPTELMDLFGVRLALIEETPEEGRLNVQRLKRTVGTSQITSRYIRQDSVTFNATHSLFLNTNVLPTVVETDHGTWRRLARLPWPLRYRDRNKGEKRERPTDRRGTDIRDRIESGREGELVAACLTWIVTGAVQWYTADRTFPMIPPVVVEATTSWRGDTDLVLGYLDERTEFDLDSWVMAGDLLADFNEWLKGNGHRPWNDKTFSQRFEQHEKVRDGGVEKLRKSGKKGLSRAPDARWVPTIVAEVPRQYWAWVGVRFR